MPAIPSAIRTERLVVRPFCDDDLPGYLAFMTDPEATRYLMFSDEQKTESGARELFELVRASYDSDEPIWALAVAPPDGPFVGSCGMSPLGGDVVECYYSLLPEHWGRGYATESTRGLIEHLFRETSIVEVRAYMSPENPNSRGVAERVGMTDRGVQTHPLFGNEGAMYSVTREEWR